MTSPADQPLSPRADSARVACPLFQAEDGGSIPTSALRARALMFAECDKLLAVRLVRRWHSRLPRTQSGPWQYAFSADIEGVIYAVALWHNPSTRSLPSHWLELRRLACAPDAPKNTCSRFLAWMVRWFADRCPERERCISYQDTAVHSGTIYRAAGWIPAYISVERQRDRTGYRRGTHRRYRTNLNGPEADRAKKVRWEKML